MSGCSLRWSAGALLGALLMLAGCGDDDASLPFLPPDDGKYSNLTLVGPWLLLSPAANCHLEADGMGNITEHGFINEGSPPGYYTVASDGSFALTINTSSPVVLSGQFTSDSTAALEGSPDPVLFKVADRSLCQGNWTGTLDRTSPAETKNMSFTVNSSGVVSSLTGLTGFDKGKMYAVGADFVAFWVTSESPPWDQVRPSGTLTADTATGEFDLNSGSNPEGTCSFTRN